MRIKKFRIVNHKSYRDSGELNFEKGVNIIVGKNNAGKTALLEALSMEFNPVSHKSLKTKPNESSPLNHHSFYEVEFIVNGSLVKDSCLNISSGTVPVPVALEGKIEDSSIKQLLDKIFNMQEVSFKFEGLRNGGGFEWSRKFSPSLNIYPVITSENNFLQVPFKPVQNKTDFIANANDKYLGNSGEEFSYKIANAFKERIYKFKAQRFSIGTCKTGANTKLTSNASNLPEVLSMIQAKPKLFAQYNKYVSQIFPHIKRISSAPINTTDTRINVHTNDSEREDLSFTLEECGTGVSQVLAMLYVALCESEEHVIIIDEPNTFLHAGAVKTLMGILSSFEQHQYIISTHSTEIFKSPKVSTLKLIYWDEGESKVQEFSKSEITDTKNCLLELGIEMSDILSSDRLIWTEGATEAECLPRILRSVKKWDNFTTSFVAVKTTGDFDGKKANLVCDIYLKMSETNLPLPANTKILFDSEGKSDKEKEDLSRKGKGKIYFLPRKMFENYLIHIPAITALLNEFECFKVKQISESEVLKWLELNWLEFSDLKGKKSKFDLTEPEWISSVHGANLVKKLVSDLTEATQEYNKIKHGIFITEWLLVNEPLFLGPIADFAASILD